MVEGLERGATRILTWTFAAASAFAVPAKAQTQPCWDTAVTQAQLNACAADEAKVAEAEMNRVYAEVLRAHRANRPFIRRVKAAQAAWQKYRDAELAARFPVEGAPRQYGSAFPMCTRMEAARLFKERTATLRALLPTEQAQDVCSGAPAKKR